MREDDEIGHYVPLLRRIIILVAVITAIPVVLWTITAFVRTYVGPPRVPTFHQLASTASINAPLNIKPDADTSSAPSSATEQARPADLKPADLSPPRVEARATATDARDMSNAPKGPFLGDRPADNNTAAPAVSSMTATGAPASASKTADASPTIWPDPKPPVMLPPAAAAAPDAPANPVITAEQRTATAGDAADDAIPAAAPLAGPVPLPRRRPHVIAAAETATTTATATPAAAMPMTQMASAGPTSIPMPRPRPDAAGPGTPADTSSGNSPLEFLSNIFGGK
jgi:hypothetical protein